MPHILTNQQFLAIATAITNPRKNYYSLFPEFTPLEFEHFCCRLLQILDYQILRSNDTISADGGIDFVAKKQDTTIVIGQCKKSDWQNKSLNTSSSNIGEPTVKQHFGQVCLEESNYPDQTVVGYVMTLRKFSVPCRQTFASNSKIRLIDFFELRRLVSEAMTRLDGNNKQVVIVQSTLEVWQDTVSDQIKIEIDIVESLVANVEIELEREQNKSNQVEKLIMNELVDLYREIELITAEIQFLRNLNAKKVEQQDEDEDLTEQFAKEQEEINEQFDDLEQEYIDLPDTVMGDEDIEATKNLYRELSHLYHPDKHPSNSAEFTKIFQAINKSKGNLASLQDIKDNPHKYFAGKIPDNVDITKEQLIKYLSQLQVRLSDTQEKLEILREGQNAKLYAMYHTSRPEFDQIVSNKRQVLEQKLADLRLELESLS